MNRLISELNTNDQYSYWKYFVTEDMTLREAIPFKCSRAHPFGAALSEFGS
jgi:hypothetical protein